MSGMSSIPETTKISCKFNVDVRDIRVVVYEWARINEVRQRKRDQQSCPGDGRWKWALTAKLGNRLDAGGCHRVMPD